jgi:hypothetical protein
VANPFKPLKLTQLNFRVAHPSRLCFTRRVGFRVPTIGQYGKIQPIFSIAYPRQYFYEYSAD